METGRRLLASQDDRPASRSGAGEITRTKLDRRRPSTVGNRESRRRQEVPEVVKR